MIDEQAAQSDHAAELRRLQTRCALLTALLGEAIRLNYVDRGACSPSWLDAAQRAVAPLL